jgi:hypothetical protein
MQEWMMTRLNLAFLAILVVGTGLFGGGLLLVHGIQVRRHAAVLLDRARRAEARQEPQKVALVPALDRRGVAGRRIPFRREHQERSR